MTVPYYGKRNPGSLTAASPGDTLFFHFGSYNDSGDSEALSGLAVTDIEVFKNGGATARATDSGYSLISDTGQQGDRVGLYRFSLQLYNTADDASFYAVNSWYQVAVDAVTIDGKTVRFWVGSFEIGFNITAADTGINDRLGKIQSDVDTGLRAHISDVDTGVHAVLATTLAANVLSVRGDTGAARHLWELADEYDTGRLQAEASATLDTGAVNQAVWQENANRGITKIGGDTGAVRHLQRLVDEYDTGRLAAEASATLDTGAVNQAVWQANAARSITASSDTGINDHLGRIRADVDTGLRAQISDVDTGIHAIVALLPSDTGLYGTMADYDTGIRDLVSDIKVELDTGLRGQLALQDTGFVANAVWNSLRSAHVAVGSFGESDTGVNQRFGQIQSDVDTGLRAQLSDVDTGLHDTIADLDTGLRDYVNDVVREVDTGIRANLLAGTYDTGIMARLGVIGFDVDTGLRAQISDVDTGLHDAISDIDTGLRAKFKSDTGGWPQVNIRKVNDVEVIGIGDTGTNNTWRPGP